MSLSDISNKSGLPLPEITSIFAGREPSLYELAGLAKALNLNVRTASTASAAANVPLLFRKNASEAEKLEAARLRVLGFIEGVRLLLPDRPPSLEWIRRLRPGDNSYAAAAHAASGFRALFVGGDEFEPLHNLPEILEGACGINICSLSRTRIEGVSFVIDSHPFILYSPRFAPRVLFTIAHELGHLIAHHELDQSVPIYDTPRQVGSVRGPRKGAEYFANTFAGLLLMPDQGIGAALRTIRETFSIPLDAELGDIEIGYLARIFGVSFAVAAQRCEDLRLLPAGGAGSLVAALEKEYRSAERRGDQAGLPPRIPIIIPRISSALLRALKIALGNESISIGFASEVFSLPPAQLIEELRREA